jgi:hypothetical protein
VTVKKPPVKKPPVKKPTPAYHPPLVQPAPTPAYHPPLVQPAPNAAGFVPTAQLTVAGNVEDLRGLTKAQLRIATFQSTVTRRTPPPKSGSSGSSGGGRWHPIDWVTPG